MGKADLSRPQLSACQEPKPSNQICHSELSCLSQALHLWLRQFEFEDRGICRHGGPYIRRFVQDVKIALQDLERSYSALYRNVCDETGTLRRHLNVFVNSDNVRDFFQMRGLPYLGGQ